MSDVPVPSARVFLKTKEDFERVKRDGVRVTTRLFNMMSCASGRGETRVGIVVGRRFGNAVARNRGKRVFRALVRTTREWLLQGNDLVIFPKRLVLTISHSTLHTTWLTTLTSQGLMVPPDPLSPGAPPTSLDSCVRRACPWSPLRSPTLDSCVRRNDGGGEVDQGNDGGGAGRPGRQGHACAR